MLVKSEIIKEIKKGKISITPFKEKNLNPNSYDLTLGSRLLIYTSNIIDVKAKQPTLIFDIPEEGFILTPGELYLTQVNESISSNDFISGVQGKSGLARLGLSVHQTAGFGDIGFKGKYVLELSVLKHLIVYKDMRIAQLFFLEPYYTSNVLDLYAGHYNNQHLEGSEYYKNFGKETKV